MIEIKHDQIISISKNDQFAKAIDAKGLLMLPSFKDMHIHLDKTFYGDKWQAVRKHGSGVKGMIELEQKIMPELLKTSTHKAEKLIELLQSKGTTYARSHVNIEPTSQLNSLKNLEKALAVGRSKGLKVVMAMQSYSQLVKEFIRLIGTKVTWLNLNSQRSFLLSAVVAFVVAYYFNIDFTKYLPLLDGFDADLMQMINALLLMFASNKLHPATDAG